MKLITITSKRQATLPAELCDDLGVGPGDKLELERRTVAGEPLWVLRARKPDWSWFGAAKRYAKGRPHGWEAIEQSISKGMAGDRRP
jgi:bifunctional DNA-binding transcriptional regulator/antitoxin component of YhaV-PrlF toxin-antitoxin module